MSIKLHVQIKRVTRWSSLPVAAVSVVAMIFTLHELVPLRRDFYLPLLTVAIAFAIGAYAKELSQAARKFARSPRIFLSYSQDDTGAVKNVASQLRSRGAKVWLGREQIKPGQNWTVEIAKAIDDSDVMLVFIHGPMGPFSLREAELAKERGVKVVPVLLESTPLPASLRDLKWIDLRGGNKQEALQELMTAAAG